MHSFVLTLASVNVLNPHSLISSFGALGIGLILFAETALLVGFFLPGDSLLFTAGILCAVPPSASLHLSLPWVLVAAVLGACLGAQTGFVLGARLGPKIFDSRKNSKLRHGRDATEEYLARYGHARAIMLARFTPVIRTVINPAAAVLNVPVKVFTRWQIIGGLGWTIGLIMAGYALGNQIHNVDRYLLPIVATVIVASLVPLLAEVMRARRNR